jgi:DNA-binding transcriptional regulator YdaS (Cro superfamily)
MVEGVPSNQALISAIEKVGGQSAMGRLVGFSQAAVWKWVRQGKALPAEHVLKVEAATGISRHDLRPDLYPREAVGPDQGVVTGLEAAR